MPFLSDFPNEILDELMECILAISPPSQLQAFLLSRQYNPSVLRALYLDVRFLVNSDSQMASLKDANDEKMTAMIRNNLLAFDLLASTALQSPHLFEHTNTVQLEIFETYSISHSVGMLETRGLHFSGRHSSDPTFAAIWAESVASILSAVPAVEHLVCDWFMDMEGVTAKIQRLSRLRTLQLRGIKYPDTDFSPSATVPDDLVLPAGLENLRISFFKFDPELNFKMASTPNTSPAQLKLEAIDCRPYQSRLEPEPGSDVDLATYRAGYTEARIVHDELCSSSNMEILLEQSYNTLERLEFLDRCECGLASAAELYSRWSRFDRLHRLSLSTWVVPDPSLASKCQLKELTHLQLNIGQGELATFSARFEEILHHIEEGRLFPKLKSIKLSTRRTHSTSEDDCGKWSLLRLYIQHEWSDKGPSEFCGWTKAPYSVKDAPNHTFGMYKFASGIELDITDILALANKLEQLPKPPPLSGRLTHSESMIMAMVQNLNS